MCLLKISQIFQNIAVGLAAIAGGIWAFYRWRKERGHETSLEIYLDSTSTVYRNDLYLVFIDVSLKNVGKVRVVAKKKEYDNDSKITKPVYKDKMETINHSLGLQLRAIRSDIDCSAALDWFSSNKLDAPKNIPNEINLFSYFEENGQDKPDEIMIEPATTHNFGYPFIIPAGHYLTMVTFVGERKIDFYRRLFYINVPSSEKQKEPARASH